jgi:anti-anti-sigma regulatory factor
MHLFSPMSLKIVRESDGKRTTLRLSGRIQSANVEEFREQMKGDAERIVLDLEEVTLVDVEVVRFLGVREAEVSNS